MKDFSKTKLFKVLHEYLEKGTYEMDLKSMLHTLGSFLEELRDYIHSKKDYETLPRSLNLACIVFDSLKDYYHTEELSSIGICIRNAIRCLQKEIELVNNKATHPEWFLSETKECQSNLYIVPKSNDGLGIIGFVELVVALFLLGGIYTKNGKKATLIQIANAFEQTFNFSFGSIYKKQIKLFDRKGCNLTRLLDSLRNLLHKESRRRENEKE